MITYRDGAEMRVGDSVLIEHETVPGTITEILASASRQKECNVDEAGIMIESPPFGLLFLPMSTFVHDPIVLVRRGET